MARHIAANALTFLILGLVVIFGLVTWSQTTYRAQGPLNEPLEFEVARGETMNSVVDKLAGSEAISDERIFRIAARYTGLDEGLRFGEYLIPAGASMEDILKLLNKGANVARQIIIPEGWTSWEIVEGLRAREELSGEIAEVPPEGSLAPAGYDFQKGDTRESLLIRMTNEQTRILADAWEGRAPDLPVKSPEELLILASIIEKETGLPEERPEVAAVFVNRLNKGMKLQTDPTVIYGITLGKGPLGRGLRASELATATPYNTYAIPGLPPTPIANPGRDAINAAANPVTSEYLFFVADGTGGHAFATTLAEHNANVVMWRRLEAQKAKDAKAAEAQQSN
jgi:UPF0755 protein